ncbi:unnamed protein product [Phaeothamnion confervicola]
MAITERHIAQLQRDAAYAERETACAERDVALQQRDTAFAERGKAAAERDFAEQERDAALKSGPSTKAEWAHFLVDENGYHARTAILQGNLAHFEQAQKGVREGVGFQTAILGARNSLEREALVAEINQKIVECPDTQTRLPLIGRLSELARTPWAFS